MPKLKNFFLFSFSELIVYSRTYKYVEYYQEKDLAMVDI